MSWTTDEAASEIGVERRVVVAWVEQQWVLPAEKDGIWLFEEVDLARLKLIKDLVGELEIDEEAMPVLLSLLDQLYEARRALAELEGAIAACTDEVRDEIAARLARRD